MKRPLLTGLAILIAWMLLDVLLHRLFLAPLYEASRELWRPFDQMNVTLIYAVTIVLIGVFVGVYRLLVSPKSLGTGFALGAFVGLALGVSGRIGHVHSHANSAGRGLELVHRWLGEGTRRRRDRGGGDRRVLKRSRDGLSREDA
jgi:hypothetical protein